MTDDGTKPFRLLNLPSVASTRVIKQMTLMELFKLSLTTKKTRKTIKSSFAKNYFHVTFDMSMSTKIELENEKHGPPLNFYGYPNEETLKKPDTDKAFLGEYNIEKEKMKIYLKSNGEVSFYWDDPQRGIEIVCCAAGSPEYNRKIAMRSWMNYIVDVFNNPMFSLNADFGGETLSWEVIEFVKKQNIQWKNVDLRISTTSKKEYEYILSECKEINSLRLRRSLPYDFRYDPLTIGIIKLNYIFIANAHWVKLEDFMECKSIELGIQGPLASDSPYMKSPYLNTFLKKWIASESRIEELKLPFESTTDFSLVVEGLTSADNEIGQHTGGHYLKIKRHDGKKAVVYYLENYLYFFAGTKFRPVARLWNTPPS